MKRLDETDNEAEYGQFLNFLPIHTMQRRFLVHVMPPALRKKFAHFRQQQPRAERLCDIAVAAGGTGLRLISAQSV